MSLLAKLHAAVGNTTAAAKWALLADQTTTKIHDSMWDDEDGFYYYMLPSTTHAPPVPITGLNAKMATAVSPVGRSSMVGSNDSIVTPGNAQFHKVKTPSGFAPLLLDGVPPERVARLIQHLQNASEFGTKQPLPSVSADHPAYSTNMWRGAQWININFLTILGLRKYAHIPGALDAAAVLQKAAVAAVADGYFKYGVPFEFYDSRGVEPPTTLERKGNKRSGGVRDYHWTSALVFWMLYNENGTLPDVS